MIDGVDDGVDLEESKSNLYFQGSGTRHLPVDLVESLISSIVHNKAIGKKGGRG